MTVRQRDCHDLDQVDSRLAVVRKGACGSLRKLLSNKQRDWRFGVVSPVKVLRQSA
jgi:hypothetical protein